MLYHSSTADAIDNILDNGFTELNSWPRNINFLFSDKKVKYLGNFGMGTYAFWNNPKLSKFFIKKELRNTSDKHFKTIEFELKKCIEERGQKRKVNVLKLCPNSPDLEYFQDYVEKYSKNIKRVLNKFEKANGKSKIKVAGAIIEYFIFYLKDENGKKIKVDAVCGTSTTNNVFKLDISDGIEYCIRNIKAIDNDSVKLYNENEDIERRR